MVAVHPRLVLLLFAAGVVLLLLALRFDPARPHARALRSCTAGLFILLAWNALPLPHLGINPLSTFAAGSLGLPGLGLLAVLTRFS